MQVQVQEGILDGDGEADRARRAAEIIGSASPFDSAVAGVRYGRHGFDGLLEQRRGARSGSRVPRVQVGQVLERDLKRLRAFGAGVTGSFCAKAERSPEEPVLHRHLAFFKLDCVGVCFNELRFIIQRSSPSSTWAWSLFGDFAPWLEGKRQLARRERPLCLSGMS